MKVKFIVETFYDSLLGYGVRRKEGRDSSIVIPFSPRWEFLSTTGQASTAGIMRAKSLPKNTTK